MAKQLNILHLEDEPSVVKVVSSLLEKEGFSVKVSIIQTKPEFLKAVQNHKFDLIISDYALVGFDGLDALRLLRQEDKTTPFILFSGSIGEERAIDSLRQGATDYVLKQNIKALIPAIKRALKERDSYLKRELAEQQLAEEKRYYQNILDQLD